MRNAGWMIGLLLIGQMAAGVDVTIEKQAEGKVSVNLADIRAQGEPGALFVQTLQGNLNRSGWFHVVAAGAGVSVSGTAGRDGSDRFRASGEVAWSGGRFRWDHSGDIGDVRRQAHLLADEMVRRVLGRRGMAASRIAMVGRVNGVTEIYISDADGGSMFRLTQDGTLSLTPKWEPTGKGLFYTGYLRGYPGVYHIDLERNRRRLVAGYPGLNTGAVVSPDGQHIALVLSRTGNPELYVKNLATERLVRLTYTPHAVEASPSWSPDGRQIVYVSDSTGMPQLYVIGVDRREPRRLTFRNRENVSPNWGPDGRIVHATRVGAGYQLAITDSSTGEMTQITDGPATHEEPTWAPNARHIACVQVENYRSRIVILDTMGDPPIPLHTLSGDWMTPNWSVW